MSPHWTFNIYLHVEVLFNNDKGPVPLHTTSTKMTCGTYGQHTDQFPHVLLTILRIQKKPKDRLSNKQPKIYIRQTSWQTITSPKSPVTETHSLLHAIFKNKYQQKFQTIYCFREYEKAQTYTATAQNQAHPDAYLAKNIPCTHKKHRCNHKTETKPTKISFRQYK